MVIKKSLSDFSSQKDAIVTSVEKKLSNGLFKQDLHDIFNKGRRELNIQDIKQIIETIEIKLRNAEIIYYTFFGTEYNKNILVNDSLIGNKIIETEFNFGTKVIKKRIEIIDPAMYKETIIMNFQLYILTVASLYENLVRLIETLVKKRVVFGENNPHPSVHLKVFISYWDNLILLDYRSNDVFFDWLNNHRSFFNKYLGTINGLRNSFIHGYSTNLKVENNTFVVSNFETIQPNSNSLFGFNLPAGGGIIPELEVDTFVKDILEESTRLTKELMELFKQKLSHHRTKIPM